MILYSKSIISFLSEIKQSIRKILSVEVGLKVTSSRFFDQTKNYSYPISVVIFNGKNTLGYFDPSFYELGFHEKLRHQKQELVENILRHEIAHYLCYLKHGDTIKPHGKEFLALCQEIGWGKEVSCSSICEDELELNIEKELSTLRKIKKLLALSSSSSLHESEQAMLKVQELLLKNQLQRPIDVDEETACLKRVLKQKVQTAKLRAIAKVLETFFVSTIFHKAKGCICLEIVGEKENVLVAEYVANFLDLEFERLWNHAKKEHPALSGKVAKNSFLLGIAKGYCNHLCALARSHAKDHKKALICIEKKLQRLTSYAYDRLKSQKSQSKYCRKSNQIGESIGQKLSIKPAVSKKPSTKLLSLLFD